MPPTSKNDVTREPNTFHYPRWQSMEQLRTAVMNSGNHFFDRGAMRFFDSRIGGTLYGERFFVTSEQSPNAPRRYTVRFVRKTLASDGDWHMTVTEASNFQEFATHKQAVRFAERAAQRIASNANVTPLTYDSDAEYLDTDKYREV